MLLTDVKKALKSQGFNQLAKALKIYKEHVLNKD